jgi:hypothetical protein
MAKAKGVEAHIGDCGANCDSSENRCLQVVKKQDLTRASKTPFPNFKKLDDPPR